MRQSSPHYSWDLTGEAFRRGGFESCVPCCVVGVRGEEESLLLGNAQTLSLLLSACESSEPVCLPSHTKRRLLTRQQGMRWLGNHLFFLVIRPRRLQTSWQVKELWTAVDWSKEDEIHRHEMLDGWTLQHRTDSDWEAWQLLGYLKTCVSVLLPTSSPTVFTDLVTRVLCFLSIEAEKASLPSKSRYRAAQDQSLPPSKVASLAGETLVSWLSQGPHL